MVLEKVVCFDPDAPSPEAPVNRSFLHWLVANIPPYEHATAVQQGTTLPHLGKGDVRASYCAAMMKELKVLLLCLILPVRTLHTHTNTHTHTNHTHTGPMRLDGSCSTTGHAQVRQWPASFGPWKHPFTIHSDLAIQRSAVARQSILRQTCP